MTLPRYVKSSCPIRRLLCLRVSLQIEIKIETQAGQKLGGGQVHIVVLVGNALGWGDPIIQQCKTLPGLLDEDGSV